MPLLEILEMPGIFPSPEVAKKAILAWKPTEAKILDEKANAVLLAMAVYPDQAIWSKKPRNGCRLTSRTSCKRKR